MLDKIGFKKKIHVGICVSANNRIELVCIDNKTKEVVKYVSSNIKYNVAIREIMDFQEFSEAIEQLFEEAELDPAECCVTVTIPTVHFAVSSLDVANKSYLLDQLGEEIEDLYIFRKNESKIVYDDFPHPKDSSLRSIVYGAIQEKVIRSILEVFDSFAIEVVRIDMATTSLLRTMHYCERFNKFIEGSGVSSILLVTSSTCSIMNLNNNMLVNVIEEPLAIKSFSIEEVYAIISKTLAKSMEQFQPNSLLVISETDEINAEQLAGTLSFNCDIDYINKNASASEDFIGVDQSSDVDENIIPYISIEAVGAAVADYEDFPIDINFLPVDRIKKTDIIFLDYDVSIFTFVGLIVGIVLLVVGVIVGLLSLLSSQQINVLKNDTKQSEKQIQVFRNNANNHNNQGDLFPIMEGITNLNKGTIDTYNALSSVIPEDIFIKRFVKNPAGGIGIVGEAKSSESVNVFIKGLKEKNETLMVSKLSINDSSTPNIYIPNGVTFEIKTSNIDVQFVSDVLNFQSSQQSMPMGQPPVL